ncbi:Peptidoglycan glycosyltransferase MrdB [Candidatus Entotheonellaceae bacterium PAL068K]
MQFDRRSALNFDWITLALTLAIVALSVILLYSATSYRAGSLAGIYVKQLSWLGVGCLGMRIVLCIDYQILSRYAYVFYGLTIVGLVAVLLFARVINGAQRWLTFGPWHLQISEFVKPVLILVLARHFAEETQQSDAALTLRALLVPLALVGLPFLLIAKQPDLSTSIVLLVLLCAMIMVVGLQKKALVVLSLLSIIALPAMWYLLKEYQRNRLLALFQPHSDLLGAGYHSWQSKIAIGSGGWWGKGLFAGTQSRLHFLPEKHTDFIFAVLGEEMGFMGVLLLLSLFCSLLWRGFTTAYHSRDRLGALIAIGVVTILMTHIFLNIGMTTGLLPIIGLPLPLVSYGGSSLASTFLCLGLVMNVRRRRFKF